MKQNNLNTQRVYLDTIIKLSGVRRDGFQDKTISHEISRSFLKSQDQIIWAVIRIFLLGFRSYVLKWTHETLVFYGLCKKLC